MGHCHVDTSTSINLDKFMSLLIYSQLSIRLFANVFFFQHFLKWQMRIDTLRSSRHPHTSSTARHWGFYRRRQLPRTSSTLKIKLNCVALRSLLRCCCFRYLRMENGFVFISSDSVSRKKQKKKTANASFCIIITFGCHCCCCLLGFFSFRFYSFLMPSEKFNGKLLVNILYV